MQMKALGALATWVLVGMVSSSFAETRPLKELEVLYVGGTDPRAQVFERFLSKHVKRVKSANRVGFDPTTAGEFDVVVLDWPQSERTSMEWKSGVQPLGNRGDWEKPTVLLGSAGLNVAVTWKGRGGSG